MSKSKNNVAIPRDDALSFAVVSANKPISYGDATKPSGPCHKSLVNHTFYLSNETAALQEPDAKIALIYVEEGCNTLELDDGEKHVGILGEWSLEGQITHKFTCLDDFAPEGHSVFMRSVTRKAE